MDYKEVPLSKGFFAKVSPEDWPEIKKHKWSVTRSANNWYAVRSENRKRIYMHRQIAKPTNGEVTHHVNGDSLDNRRENLENTTQSDNLHKRKWRQ